MRHPEGRCGTCGERLFAHVDGGYRCHNCGTHYVDDEDDGLTEFVVDVNDSDDEPDDSPTDNVDGSTEARELSLGH